MNMFVKLTICQLDDYESSVYKAEVPISLI